MDFNKNYRLAVDDEEYPIGFSDAINDAEAEEDDQWDDEEFYIEPDDDNL